MRSIHDFPGYTRDKFDRSRFSQSSVHRAPWQFYLLMLTINYSDADAECPGWRMGITLKPKLEPSMKTDKSTYEGEEEESAVGETGTGDRSL